MSSGCLRRLVTMTRFSLPQLMLFIEGHQSGELLGFLHLSKGGIRSFSDEGVKEKN